MADTKITGFAAGTVPLTGTEVIPAVQGAANVKITAQQIADLAATQVGINAQTGTTYVFLLTDAGKVIRQSNAGAIVNSIRVSATVAFPIGSVVTMRQVAAGQITVTPDSGVTLNIPTGTVAKTRAQGSTVMIHKVGTNEWDITGDLATS